MKNRKTIRKNKQLSFPFMQKVSRSFGGSELKGKRKIARSLSTKESIHLVIRSDKAKGKFCLLYYRSAIAKIIGNVAKKYHIRIYAQAVNTNHIHIVILIPSRESYSSFIRVVTGMIVSMISRRTGEALSHFWSYRPFTQIATWGRQYQALLKYIQKNLQEAEDWFFFNNYISSG